jgi:hypothetical protein
MARSVGYRAATGAEPVDCVAAPAGASGAAPALTVPGLPEGVLKNRKKLESGFNRKRVSLCFIPVS